MKVSGEITKNLYSLHFLQDKKIEEMKIEEAKNLKKINHDDAMKNLV